MPRTCSYSQEVANRRDKSQYGEIEGFYGECLNGDQYFTFFFS